jgi:spermidine/putrescine transport system permease protein
MSFVKELKKEKYFFIGSPALIWQILFFYLPLALMLASSLWEVSEAGSVTGITLKNFYKVLTKTHLFVILKSLLLSFFTAVLAFCIAYPLAHFIIFHAKKYKSLMLFFLIVPFWTNFLLHVYAWFFVLEKQGFLNNTLLTFGFIQEPIGFLNSLFAIILMMVYCYFPFMVLPIVSSLERFDNRLLEASHDLGASRIQTLTKITLPLTMPAIRAGFFLVFIPSFGEFIIPELMGGDKRYFVGNVVSQYILGNDTETIGSAFMVISALVLILSSFIIYRFFNRWSGQEAS